jgi:hypothetical protein
MVEEPRAREPDEMEFGELPELTRALRALGSSRRNAGAMQALFFRPLLDARRKAESSRAPEGKLNAFDHAELEAGLQRVIDRIVAEWPDAREPARRAIRAQVAERVQDYEAELHRLRDAATSVRSADEPARLAAWRVWTKQLRAVFTCADRTWLAVEMAVKALSAKSHRRQ